MFKRSILKRAGQKGKGGILVVVCFKLYLNAFKGYRGVIVFSFIYCLILLIFMGNY